MIIFMIPEGNVVKASVIQICCDKFKPDQRVDNHSTQNALQNIFAGRSSQPHLFERVPV